MSATLDLLLRRRVATAELRLSCAEGTLVVQWSHGVDHHELAKAQIGNDEQPWAEIWERVTSLVDCEGAEYWVEP